MKKTRYYSTINAKIVFIIVMVIIFALQLIGANFITQTERQLVASFQDNQQLQANFLENSILPYLEMHNNPETVEENILPAFVRLPFVLLRRFLHSTRRGCHHHSSVNR